MGQEPEAPAADAVAEKPAGQEPEPAPAAKEAKEPQTFGADYVKQLRSENAGARKKAQELEARLSEIEERDQSEVQKLGSKVTKAEARAQEAESKLLRYEIAQEKEVPARLVPLLTATDRDGLEEQAALILENAKPEREPGPKPDFDAGARDPAAPPKEPQDAHNDFLVELFGGTQQQNQT